MTFLCITCDKNLQTEELKRYQNADGSTAHEDCESEGDTNIRGWLEASQVDTYPGKLPSEEMPVADVVGTPDI
jgi:hypothetical protein